MKGEPLHFLSLLNSLSKRRPALSFRRWCRWHRRQNHWGWRHCYCCSWLVWVCWSHPGREQRLKYKFRERSLIHLVHQALFPSFYLNSSKVFATLNIFLLNSKIREIRKNMRQKTQFFTITSQNFPSKLKDFFLNSSLNGHAGQKRTEWTEESGKSVGVAEKLVKKCQTRPAYELQYIISLTRFAQNESIGAYLFCS